MLTTNEIAYSNLLNEVLTMGKKRPDRTGTGTIALFGTKLDLDLKESFPILSGKKMFMKGMIGELLWMLSGETNINFLKENNIKIWNEWADENNEVGKIYGYQWRKWDGKIDQLKEVIEGIKTNPYSRRHLISAWNPTDIEDCGLPPCHVMFQFFVEDKKLSCQVYQRSADMFLGVPFDMGLYGLLTEIVAMECDLIPDKLTFTFGDTHIYLNHKEAVLQYFNQANEIKAHPSCEFSRPKLSFRPKLDLQYDINDFKLHNYKPKQTIKAEISV